MRRASHWFQAVAITVLCILAGCLTPASAQSWPQRTVRVIVPNPSGVGLDLIARLFAERLSSRWGKPVIVENLPGADGNIAVREFVTRRDDHTLLYSFAAPITINPLLYHTLPYDPVRDLTPIASTSDNFLVIAASPASKLGSLADLEKAARARPNKLNWAATPGLPYFAFAGFQKDAGLDLVHVPYRDFNQAVVDLLEGRIDIAVASVAPLLAHERAGKIKFLACFSDQRAPIAPEVMTVAEAGYQRLTFNAITGFFGPRDMPAELRNRIADDVQAVAADAAIIARLASIGSIVRSGTPAQFAAAIEQQRTTAVAVAAAIGAKPIQ